MGEEKNFFKIGELAELAGVTVRTLRYYEELGLLSPTELTSGGFRLYTDHDLNRLVVIKRFKDLGFSLEEIGELFKGTKIGESKKQKIDASYFLLQKQLEQINNKITELKNSQDSILTAMGALETCKNCSQEICPATCSNRKALL
ncbi:MerR family transcriptional regulator [Desulfitobacterium sp.]|uniref:helix-turn-helix domain-containing protein n=1 Tax=Desulfitobacterium sp. TaxID=49981 RepID=UPI002C68788E|nr:MerR family transcriptional regulator [Desulfitobacterium sp.]HVJ49724.1 MerR family transcriptional regulator [Desulfitobacterium sp.]